jgi:LacI family transcriptional regulator
MNESELLNQSPRASIVREIRQGIAQGIWKRGESLPSSADLAKQFDVNRKTAQRAIQELREDGLLEIKGRRFRVLGDETRKPIPPLMAQTIGVLRDHISSAKRREIAKHQPGRSDRVLLGTLEQLDEYAWNAFFIKPSQVEQATDLVQTHLRGILIPDYAYDKLEHWQDDPLLTALQQSQMPVVVFSSTAQPGRFDTVRTDHVSGSYMLTRWLIEQGCRRILPVWEMPGDRRWYAQRYEGYAQAMKEKGLPVFDAALTCPSPLWAGDDSRQYEQQVHMVAGYLINQLTAEHRPDALMAISDRLALYLASACRVFGLKPGKDIHIVGYDNYIMDCEERVLESYWPAATVDKRNDQIGHEMVHMMMQRLNRQITGEAVVRDLKPTLITGIVA